MHRLRRFVLGALTVGIALVPRFDYAIPQCNQRECLPVECGNACIVTGSFECMCLARAVTIICEYGEPPQQYFGSDCTDSVDPGWV
jgi:hypothetical protein